MKSKELIQEYIQECDKYGWCEYEGKYWKPELQIILKDLEVLEILKKYVKLVDLGDREVIDGDLMILRGSKITKAEEYQKIKEWLEED